MNTQKNCRRISIVTSYKKRLLSISKLSGGKSRLPKMAAAAYSP